MNAMNYITLVVHPSARDEERGTHQATVVTHGHDLFGSLELAVAFLGQRGWTVDDLSEFRIAEADEQENRSDSEDLFAIAESEGCACSVNELDVTDPRRGTYLNPQGVTEMQGSRLLDT